MFPSPEPALACPNCGALGSGPWCAACGQEFPIAHGALLRMARHQWRRVAHSLWALVVHPGLLTAEFRDGQRARSVSPWRLTFNVVTVFFVLSFVTEFRVANFPRLDPTGTLRTTISEGAKRANVNEAAFAERLDRRFNSIYTLLVIVIVGARALVARLTHWRHPAAWSVHVVFALHLTAWAFVANLVYFLAIRALGVAPLGIVADALTRGTGMAILALFELWQFGYLLLAFQRVYADGRLAAAAKAVIMVAVGLLAGNGLVFLSLWLALFMP